MTECVASVFPCQQSYHGLASALVLCSTDRLSVSCMRRLIGIDVLGLVGGYRYWFPGWGWAVGGMYVETCCLPCVTARVSARSPIPHFVGLN